MKKMYCPQCGGEIILILERNDQAWGIDGDKLVRVDNDLRDQELDFFCENDKEHDIYPKPDSVASMEDFELWKDLVVNIFVTIQGGS